MKKIVEKKELTDTITSDDVLGKEVIDKTGAVIGVVEKLHIDPNKVEFVGISVDKGLVKKGLAIGRSYISKITDHGVILNIRPSYKLKKLQVFDKRGRLVGKVVDINLKGHKNDIESLVVKVGIIKKVNIPNDQIEDIGENILLNVLKEDL